MRPDDEDRVASETLEDWQFWVFDGSYRLHDMGLDDGPEPPETNSSSKKHPAR
jgi:hypothetical protein